MQRSRWTLWPAKDSRRHVSRPRRRRAQSDPSFVAAIVYETLKLIHVPKTDVIAAVFGEASLQRNVRFSKIPKDLWT